MASPALLLLSHGTVDDLADLAPFVTRIRRGHAPPPSMLAELRRRYEAIGGHSPLNTIGRELASKLQARLQFPVRLALRLWHPSPREVIEELLALGVDQLLAVALAPHSALVYEDAARKALAELGRTDIALTSAPNWATHGGLVVAFARRIAAHLDGLSESHRAATLLVMTAHSLPVAVLHAGDRYEHEVRASAAAVARELGLAPHDYVMAFQSQGMRGPGASIEWLGPDLQSVIDGAASQGKRRVLVAPIGFLADHVEVLYDLDIEARGWVEARGLTFDRTESLNAASDFVEVLCDIGRGLLAVSGKEPT